MCPAKQLPHSVIFHISEKHSKAPCHSPDGGKTLAQWPLNELEWGALSLCKAALFRGGKKGEILVWLGAQKQLQPVQTKVISSPNLVIS